MENENINYDPHVSVDCVILGYDGESLKVLLSHQSAEAPGEDLHSLKLPGRLLHVDEDLDTAAADIIGQLTGHHNHYFRQFHAYGSPNRTKNPKDVLWLEQATNLKIGRLVTIAYLSLIRITNRTHRSFAGLDTTWYPVEGLPQLAYDHNQIIQDTLVTVYKDSQERPQLLFDMLPPKFTALQLRRLYEQICGHKFDVRNFSKTVLSKSYIVPLDEWEQNVSHRAARYYKFQASKAKQ